MGVVRHEVVLDQAVPVAVRLALGQGVEAEVDLVTGELIQRSGPALSPRRRAWVVEIAGFLARQHLLEQVEEQRASQVDGRVGISFEPRLRPGMIWWG